MKLGIGEVVEFNGLVRTESVERKSKAVSKIEVLLKSYTVWVHKRVVDTDELANYCTISNDDILRSYAGYSSRFPVNTGVNILNGYIDSLVQEINTRYFTLSKKRVADFSGNAQLPNLTIDEYYFDEEKYKVEKDKAENPSISDYKSEPNPTEYWDETYTDSSGNEVWGNRELNSYYGYDDDYDGDYD